MGQGGGGRRGGAFRVVGAGGVLSGWGQGGEVGACQADEGSGRGGACRAEEARSGVRVGT